MELRETPPNQGTASGLLSPAEQALVADLVADGLAIQDQFRPEPLYPPTGRGHYTSKTIEAIRLPRNPGPTRTATMSQNRFPLPGGTPVPLAHYLKALGNCLETVPGLPQYLSEPLG